MKRLGDRPLGAWCFLLFVALCAGGFAIMRLEASERSATEERLVVASATEVRAELGDQLARSVSLARGLRAYIVSDPDLGDDEQLAVVLQQLYGQGEHIRNIGVAPDNVIRTVYPLEGNEAAIGLRYEDVPEQYPAVELAMESQETVLAGPVELVQGGRGLIDRTPVYLEDGSYWGVVSLVLDVDSLIDSVEAETEGLGIDWALRTLDSELQASTTVSGDDELFDDADSVLTLAVPNATWELAVRGDVVPADALVYDIARVIIVLGAATISWLVYSALTQRRQARTLSRRDDLTGLANRRCLEERIERALARSRREGVPTALLYVDLDAFKAVNDLHGHRAGDHVLRTVAGRLHDRVREVDTVARIGGDEFVVLMPDTGASGVARLAEVLAGIVDAPIPWDDEELQVRASIGTAVHPTHGETMDDLLHHADAAMYDEKRSRATR